MLRNCQAPVFFHSSQAYGLTLPCVSWLLLALFYSFPDLQSHIRLSSHLLLLLLGSFLLLSCLVTLHLSLRQLQRLFLTNKPQAWS